MENIKATFNSLGEMEAAAAMLREQGVIDIKLQSEATEDKASTMELMESSLTNGIGIANDEASPGSGCIMEVLVESSRFRQVEDTIARYGGQYEGQGLG